MSLLDEFKERESNRNSEQEYWRSVEQLVDTPEYEEMLVREFPEGADSPPANFSRRRFLALMGASISLAGFSGCRWPKEEIRPFAYRPEGLVPGVPRYYATSFDINGHVNGIVATSYDGRPIKIEGNEVHPLGMGSTDSW
ncbi:MAG: TAT-variant-translocated molybdopterin oxidoreductase, partial [Gemmatimonadetes bacterium]|nr:TAT-variant-translocated molybdopterin oxidoreductase [Gemmatimonadota bacterium]